jgi:beta-glucanase (GH16 family)
MRIRFLGCFALAGLIHAQSTPRAPSAASTYHLAWSDDFNSLNLSASGSGAAKWYRSYWWNSCIPPTSDITVANGALNLKWERTEKCGNGKTATETSISTFAHDASQGYTFRYGYIQVRMKWDVANGAWPAIWAIPKQAAQGQQHTGELDFFEGEGGDPKTFFGTAHEWNGGQALWASSPNYFSVGSTDFSQWHVYGALWTPGKIAWYLDGRLLGSTKLPSIFDQQDYFLVLSMQEGANWSPGNVASNTPSQLNTSFDYVRIWQK